jgi:hypothetical protein
MATRHLSLRVDEGLIARLDREAKRERQTRSDFARTLIEEGLRMAAHPGIIFVSGPAGRRPRLARGPDVWEVARVYREYRGEGVKGITTTAELTGLHPRQIEIAGGYYDAYSEEIDQWLRELDEEAEVAMAEWERTRALDAAPPASSQRVTPPPEGGLRTYRRA